MTCPAPLAPPRRRFPVRQPRTDQLSLPTLLAAAESHPELAEGLRPMVRTIRKMQAAHALRLVDATCEVVSEREVAR